MGAPFLRTLRSSLAILPLLAGAPAAWALDDALVTGPRPGTLHLRTGDVAMDPASNLLGGPAFTPGAPYVLATDGPMSPDRRRALTDLGVHLKDYLPTNAFLVTLDQVDPARLAQLPFVTWVGAFRTEWKIAPSVLSMQNAAWQTQPRRDLAAHGLQNLRVYIFQDAPADEVLALVGRTQGALVRSDETVVGARSLGVVAPVGFENALAALACVQCVEPVAEYTDRSNIATRWVVQSNINAVTPFYSRGITGTGQVIAVIDSGVAINHCSFLDPVNPIGPLHRKILAYNTSPWYALHGTHVACTALGDDGTTNNTRGIAYNAKLVYNDHPDGTEESMFDHFALHHSQGAFIHTNSWGTDAFRDYDGGARGADAFTYQFEDDLVLFAVTDIMPLVMNPENAKNCVAVYATSQAPSQANWCFGGAAPTLDGRRKPEVGAPGCSISSASGSTGCATASQGGTSMATPAVAALATLLREYYVRGFFPSGIETPSDSLIPSGSLLRATLVNSAVDLTGQAGFPSVREGWGRVLGDNAAYFAGDASRVVLRDVRNASAGSLETGQQAVARIFVDSAAQPLKVTLAWADFPAVVNAAFTPVNDLNLVVTSPSGITYRGNVFAGGVSTAGGAADAINNLEQVLLPSPEAGIWVIAVQAAGVNQGPQGYALLATGSVSEAGCPADYNLDGNVDQDDIAALIQDIASGQSSFPPNSPDLNTDGNVDQDDVAYLINIIASTGC